MKCNRGAATPALVTAILAWSGVVTPVRAQAPKEARAAFLQWAGKALAACDRGRAYWCLPPRDTSRRRWRKLPGSVFREMLPLGPYLEERYGPEFIGILNLIANGEIHYCSSDPRRVMPLEPPPESAVETLFAAANVPRYALDLRGAAGGVCVVAAGARSLEWIRRIAVRDFTGVRSRLLRESGDARVHTPMTSVHTRG